MATKVHPPLDKIADTGSAIDHGYSWWKRRKVESALSEAEDRAVMIPAKKVWSDLGLEG